MNRKDIMPFLGKYVKIEFRSGFIIDGTIAKISEDAIFFETKQTISAVDIRNVSSIVVKRMGESINAQQQRTRL